jgi:hypothetical protein
MDIHESSEWYTERSKNPFSNLVFNFRAFYYKKYILNDIKWIIEWNTTEKNNLSILNRWCGQWHKFEKVIQLFNKLNLNAYYTGIEPSEWMREKAIKRLSLYWWIIIKWWLAQNLDNKDNSIDLVSDEQMHHHNNTANKRLRVPTILKKSFLLFNLDIIHNLRN